MQHYVIFLKKIHIILLYIFRHESNPRDHSGTPTSPPQHHCRASHAQLLQRPPRTTRLQRFGKKIHIFIQQFFFIHKIREIAAYVTTGNRISSIHRMLKNAAKIIRQKPRFRFHLVEMFLVYQGSTHYRVKSKWNLNLSAL